MDIIGAAEQLKQGKAIRRPEWGDSSIQAALLENGKYVLYVHGNLNSEIISLLSIDFEEVEVEDESESDT